MPRTDDRYRNSAVSIQFCRILLMFQECCNMCEQNCTCKLKVLVLFFDYKVLNLNVIILVFFYQY